jgi:hypothetical protein
VSESSRASLVALSAAVLALLLVDCGLAGSPSSGGAGGASSASSAVGSTGARGGGGGAAGGGGASTGGGGAQASSSRSASSGAGGATPTDVVIEAEDYDSIAAAGGHAWSSATDVPGYSGAAFMQCGPGTGATCTDTTMLDTCAPEMKYGFTLAAPGQYWFQVRMWADTTSDDSIWYGLDGAVDPNPIDAPQDSTWHWNTGDSFNLVAGGHTLTLWQRECGARVDVVALTTTPTPPP